MAVKIGDRVDFGSVVEPCGGTVAYVDHQLAIIKWDCGGETVTTLPVLAVLACEPEPVIPSGYPDGVPKWKDHYPLH